MPGRTLSQVSSALLCVLRPLLHRRRIAGQGVATENVPATSVFLYNPYQLCSDGACEPGNVPCTYGLQCFPLTVPRCRRWRLLCCRGTYARTLHLWATYVTGSLVQNTNYNIRRVFANGTIRTWAGRRAALGYAGDGLLATAASGASRTALSTSRERESERETPQCVRALCLPGFAVRMWTVTGVSDDGQGGIFIADTGTMTIRRVGDNYPGRAGAAHCICPVPSRWLPTEQSSRTLETEVRSSLTLPQPRRPSLQSRTPTFSDGRATTGRQRQPCCEARVVYPLTVPVAR